MTKKKAHEGPSERELALIESYDRRGNWRRGRYAAKFVFDGYLVTVFRSVQPLGWL